ncbi:hypothetical protein AB0K09_15195 [Streptomyces sp. NPDC049577]|uniref:hypothetical protein n=1 Tax=Streptomyces sp. NPDC049577 TaxID=3155153 RepID=UPI00342FB696
MPEPITPTRIIPAGQPLPPTAPPMPPARPGSTDLPPWRTAAPPPPPPPASPPPGGAPPWDAPSPPGPIEVRVVVDLVHPGPEPEPARRGGWWWGWLWPHLRPVQTFVGGFLALVPMPWTGYSAATTWAYVVHESRDFAVPVAYALGLGAFAVAIGAERRAAGVLRQLVARTGLVITFVGVMGAIDLFDPVTALTGVHHR